jgi:hypothetical protein
MTTHLLYRHARNLLEAQSPSSPLLLQRNADPAHLQ